jgi:hypothetical protein
MSLPILLRANGRYLGSSQALLECCPGDPKPARGYRLPSFSLQRRVRIRISIRNLA